MSKQTIKAKVIHVVDGDTFDLSDGTRVRLQGVDAPELKQIGGRESRAYLENLIKGKEVTVRVDGMHKGRVIGSVYLGNENVGLKLVQNGHAFVSPKYIEGTPQAQEIKAAEVSARMEKKGVWKDGTKVEKPWEYRQRVSQGRFSRVRPRCGAGESDPIATALLQVLLVVCCYPSASIQQSRSRI